MSAIYKYSLLQYRHSQFLGEVLNIGILILYPSLNKLSFIRPEKLIRLKFAYPNVQEKTIKTYFKAFDERIQKLNSQPELFTEITNDISFSRLIQSEFLPLDSSALQFGEIHKSLLFTDDINIIENQLYNLYFSVFEHSIGNYERVDESHLLTKYKSFIRELDKEVLNRENKRLFFDYRISPKDGDNFKFDIAWRNGSLNLVKPVSFDVARQQTIQSKAFKNYGELLELQDYASLHNLRFDLLIAKPKRKDLFKTFDNAIALLSKPKRVELVEQENLQEYSAKTVQAISLFDQ